MELAEINQELAKASEQIPEDQLDQFIAELDAHARIFVYGTGRSGLMLKAFAMRLMQMGYTAFVVGETTTPSIQKGDLLVVASSSGETGSVVAAADSAAKQGADVCAIPGAHDSTLASRHAPIIRIESASKFATSKASVQPLGSLFEQMLLMIFDAAILKMSRRREGTNEAMAAQHASIE